MAQRLLTPAEVADLLSIQITTLANWRWQWRNGGIQQGPRYVMVGSTVRYRPEDVDAYLERNTINSTSEAIGE